MSVAPWGSPSPEMPWLFSGLRSLHDEGASRTNKVLLDFPSYLRYLWAFLGLTVSYKC